MSIYSPQTAYQYLLARFLTSKDMSELAKIAKEKNLSQEEFNKIVVERFISKLN